MDDSAFFRNMLLPVLKAAGYDVTAASSGAEALEISEKDAGFDAIVSGHRNARMSGFDLAAALRGDPRFAEMPIIALSSHATPAVIEREAQGGLHNFVAKVRPPGACSRR